EPKYAAPSNASTQAATRRWRGRYRRSNVHAPHRNSGHSTTTATKLATRSYAGTGRKPPNSRRGAFDPLRNWGIDVRLERTYGPTYASVARAAPTSHPTVATTAAPASASRYREGGRRSA